MSSKPARVAIVTPVFQPRPEWLAQCHASVRAQTQACTHFMVADGGQGAPPEGFEGEFISLPQRYDDYGDTPNALGAAEAFSRGFDVVGFLDQDCWFEPHHVASLAVLQQRTGAQVCSSRRKLYDYENNFLQICPASDGLEFVDTNCYMIWRLARDLCALLATMPAEYHAIGDRYLFRQMLKQKIPHAHSGTASVCYRIRYRQVFERLGLQVPDYAVDAPQVVELIRKLDMS